jgi:hypothetical protein
MCHSSAPIAHIFDILRMKQHFAEFGEQSFFCSKGQPAHLYFLRYDVGMGLLGRRPLSTLKSLRPTFCIKIKHLPAYK